MLEIAIAVSAGLGAFYLYTSFALGWRGVALAPSTTGSSRSLRALLERRFESIATEGVDLRQFLAATAGLTMVGLIVGFATFGGAAAAALCGALTGVVPLLVLRRRRAVRVAVAQEAWPRMIEEIRVLTSSLGQSIPQAIFEVGARSPAELRPAFEAAHREWLLSTDFERTLAVLKLRLSDATADVACETLLIAHEVGGTDLDARLAALADDRRADIHSRRDAEAKQAGARFARRFVLIVPFGMALAGMSVGPGRAAYQTPFGQALVVAAIGLTIVCWVWAGAMMRLPREQRVFSV
jgi:tight adherence protein B